ncbi:MAG: hypothetical protein ACRDYA_02920 [Egibacteraceae bacterium]
MNRRLRQGFVVMAVTASMVLFGVAPAHADEIDADDPEEVEDLIEGLVGDILDDVDKLFDDLDLHQPDRP